MSLSTMLTTLFALVAFAGNSVLCRLALGAEQIDAAGFTIIRLVSGILALFIMLSLAKNGTNKTEQNKQHKTKEQPTKGSWLGAFMLFYYAVSFSYAYLTLDTGIGALILFGSVQITMISANLIKGQRLGVFEWIGLIAAFAGFNYLVFPSLTSPSLMGFILMTTSGIAWACYSLIGQKSINPLSDTAYNFLRTTPFLVVLLLFTADQIQLEPQGVLLAVLSGVFASGIGYAIWYKALQNLAVTQAAVLQLLVPVLAAAGGVIFASEILSSRLLISAAVIISGILIVILAKSRGQQA